MCPSDDQEVPRNVDQNAKFHAMVRDIARQLRLDGQKWSEEDWKRILLAAKYGQTILKNPLSGHGLVVVNTKRSRDLTLEEMTEFIAEVEAFGAQNGVDWSEDE